MKALAIMMILLGVIAMYSWHEVPLARHDEEAKAYAENFITYRNAVFNFGINDTTSYVGAVTEGMLNLPTAWHSIQEIHAAIDANGICYVYTPVSADIENATLHALDNSYSLGRKIHGLFAPTLPYQSGVSLPDFIPENSMVSYIKCN